MKRPKTGSTPKQYAYAHLRLTGAGRSKNELARKAGFSPSVANNVKYKIESTEGYHNAMLEMATKSNNLVMATMAEFEARGMKKFSNQELISALNAITSAWDRIETRRAPARTKDPEQNALRRVVLEKVEKTTTRVTTEVSAPPLSQVVRDVEVKPGPTAEEDDF